MCIPLNPYLVVVPKDEILEGESLSCSWILFLRFWCNFFFPLYCCYFALQIFLVQFLSSFLSPVPKSGTSQFNPTWDRECLKSLYNLPSHNPNSGTWAKSFSVLVSLSYRDSHSFSFLLGQRAKEPVCLPLTSCLPSRVFHTPEGCYRLPRGSSSVVDAIRTGTISHSHVSCQAWQPDFQLRAPVICCLWAFSGHRSLLMEKTGSAEEWPLPEEQPSITACQGLVHKCPSFPSSQSI